ncbi:hypothetical protein EC957_003287 [Mortierella hygrophila]|uniref:Uncharacterized protein n=1 Tax=Mortierella hygrophila TaxID=979708 RepID=A0A9P6K0L4_9FUNG|nr:hypothetical protein EC957_003287 [Mortierella hygrophila]
MGYIKRTTVQTFRRELDRFWALTAHPELSLFAAGHDNGLIVFKLERERPSHSVHQNILFYIKDKCLRVHDYGNSQNTAVLAVRRTGLQFIPACALSYKPAGRAALVTSTVDGDTYKLYNLPKAMQERRTSLQRWQAWIRKLTITVATKSLDQTCLIRETIRIKSAAWDENIILIYSAHNHIKYAHPQSLNLAGQSIIAYLQKKGNPEIALHFMREDKTRFEEVLECDNLEVDLETAKVMDNE